MKPNSKNYSPQTCPCLPSFRNQKHCILLLICSLFLFLLLFNQNQNINETAPTPPAQFQVIFDTKLSEFVRVYDAKTEDLKEKPQSTKSVAVTIPTLSQRISTTEAPRETTKKPETTSVTTAKPETTVSTLKPVSDETKGFVKAYNKLGGAAIDSNWSTIVHEAFGAQPAGSARATEVLKLYEAVLKRAENVTKRPKVQTTGPKMNLGTVICGNRREQGIAMIKSASIFSQEAQLHVIVFSDADTILALGDDLLQLRWGVSVSGWDFTFELHLEWFPPPKHGIHWRNMYAQCATQRIFFPSLLPHIDSVIYLDSDTFVLANLTHFWNHIAIDMADKQMVAAALNNEPGSVGYYTYGPLPVYRENGINAGVMLMNLTQMREFKMQERLEAIQFAFKEKISLADQDLFNVIIHMFPERFHEFSCSHNFYWIHCGGDKPPFCVQEDGINPCWCEALESDGLRVVHGNGGSFSSDYLHYLHSIYEGFVHFDVIADKPLNLFSRLREDYMAKPQNRCYILTADMLYRNAETYLHNLYT